MVTCQGANIEAPIRVEAGNATPPTFEKDIQPLLTRLGCNSGPCHGKQRGQNGFQLSLFGFDNDFDYHALTSESRGRRVFLSAPRNSLLLKKPSGEVPHGGGKRLPADSPAFAQILAWLETGQGRTPANTPALTGIQVFPREISGGNKEQFQLRVEASFTNGARQDVTHLAAFQSSESVLAEVDADGRIRIGPLPGQAAVTARFMDHFSTCQVTIPVGARGKTLPGRLPSEHFIDRRLSDQFEKLGLAPSEPASDTTFLRRIYLDLLGVLPRPEETQAWLGDPSPGKREKLARQLLDRPEFAEFQANKWADLLRPNPYRTGIKAVYNLNSWLRESFRKNTPFDQFAREVITAEGSTFRNGAAVVFRDRREPEEITPIISQLFLGMRLECAKCHHHPFEVYSQEDFFRFAAYFSRIGRKGTGLSPPISGSEEIVFLANSGTVKHPLTGEVLDPAPLKGKPRAIPAGEDPRKALAEWITRESPLFAKAAVNRVWADLMGRGLVDPVDDLRATNPPANPALLDALAEDFIKNAFDIKKLHYSIVTSRGYGLSSEPNQRNQGDGQNYSRHYRKRPRAEVLHDMIGSVTGSRADFAAMPAGSLAMEIWTFRSPSEFLDSFGRPDPNQDPPCDRSGDSTMVQALHLMNGKGVLARIQDEAGVVKNLAAAQIPLEKAVEELYLRCYCRAPAPLELQAVLNIAKKPGSARRQILEDLLWALINTPEFILID
ncbi:MAG: DUF1553 domain-containing protein [Gemmataceae bacterium]|nr:DUF1553 domain-containing protein [Gemmataceae bacterium]